MRQANLFMMSAAMLLAACGGTKDAGKTDQVLIEKSNIKIEGKRMTPEALWAMGRIGGFAVSPDGKKIAYTVAYYSVPENKSNREVFVMNADYQLPLNLNCYGNENYKAMQLDITVPDGVMIFDAALPCSFHCHSN